MSTIVSTRPRIMRRGAPLVRGLRGVTGFVVALAAWELLRLFEVLPSAWAPSIIDVTGAFFAGIANGWFLEALATTLAEWVLGLAIATLIGVTWGVLINASPTVAACSRIIVRVMRPIPSVALIPVAILLAGMGMQMVVMLVVFACVWPILFNTIYAAREVPVQYIETAKSLGVSPLAIQTRVIAVAILPGIMTGLKVAAGIALVVAVSAELVTGSGGLGGHILEMRLAARTADTYAAVVLGGIVGVAINVLFSFVQRRLLRWSPDVREGA